MKAFISTAIYTITLLMTSEHILAADINKNINRIDPGSLSNISGVIGVNIAAGDNNAQANIRSITEGKNAKSLSSSQMKTFALSDNDVASVSIGANTLTNARGLVSINQAAGSGNIQINDIAIALGENIQINSESLLMVRIPQAAAQENNDQQTANKKVSLDSSSLKGASGAIQLNQIAGHGNIAVNRVSMPLGK